MIEILIVIVIISIISSVALITVSSNSKKQLETFANQLTRILTLAEQEAMLRSVTIGVAFSRDYFQFFEYQKDSWHALTNSFHAIPDNIRLHGNVPLDGKPHIIISESGDITPFIMTLAHRGDKPDYVVKGEASGNILVETYHEKT